MIESEKSNSAYVPSQTVPYRWVFNDPLNTFNTTSKRVVPSGYDYLNDVIDVEIKITSLSDRTQLYTTSKLDINIPTAVSYTHLDVYKRQAPPLPCIS